MTHFSKFIAATTLLVLAATHSAAANWGGCSYDAYGHTTTCTNSYLSLLISKGVLTASVATGCAAGTKIAHAYGSADFGYNALQWDVSSGDVLPTSPGAGTCVNLGLWATAVMITPAGGSCGSITQYSTGNAISDAVALTKGGSDTAIVNGCHSVLKADINASDNTVVTIDDEIGGIDLQLNDGYRLGDAYHANQTETIYDGDSSTGPDGLTWNDSEIEESYVYSINVSMSAAVAFANQSNQY